MKIRCIHGFFIFEETRIGQISDFMSLYQLDLERKKNYYTFSDLVDAPNYSLEGNLLLENVATATFEGEPWEVLEANGLVYNFNTGLVVPIASITQRIIVYEAGNCFLSSGLIIPGSVTDDGSRVKDYAAWFSRDSLQFKYSEVSYV